MDGANIVYRGVEGSGGAFLFPQTVPDAINIYERVKDRKLKNNLLQQKQLDQDMKMLAPTKAWAQDLPEFQKDRAEYLQFVTDAHKGKYTNDPNYLRKKDELRERIYAQQLRSSYHQKQYDEYVRDIAKNPEMYEDDALKKAEEYKNTMLHERPDNFVLPQLNPADGVKYFYSLTPPAKSNKGYKINADGTKIMTSSTSFDDKEAIRLAEKEYDNSDNKSVRAFKKQSDKMLISDLAAKGVDYFSLPAQEQEALRKEKFVEQAVDLMKIRFKPSYSENISNAPSNVAPRQVSLKEATTSNLYTPKQINTVASDGSGRPAVVQTEGTMEWPKGTRGTGKVTLSKNSLYFDPVTNKFKKRTEAGNMDFEPGETSVIKMNDGTYKPYVFGKEVKLVKGTDSNGNPVQKTVREDIAVPLDEVKNLANKNKVQYQWAFDLANEKNTGSGSNVKKTLDDDIVESTLNFENKKGYSNFGFTSLPAGSLSKSQAIEKAKKEYLPMVKDLPLPLKAVAFDFAFNSEDPRASLMVASDVITPEQKKGLYTKGKLDKSKVEELWIRYKGDVINDYHANPKRFLDAFDKERRRSYDNTNGADEKGNEWYERVDESRRLADKLLNVSGLEKTTVGKFKGVPKGGF